MTTLHDPAVRGFASDNYSGVHPAVLAAIADANDGHQSAYGEDAYTETWELLPIDAQTNGPQLYYGLRYHTHILKPDDVETLHDQVGYWLWDSATGEVVKGFVVPRGITTLAGGTASADATGWTMHAELGHATQRRQALGAIGGLAPHPGAGDAHRAEPQSRDRAQSINREGAALFCDVVDHGYLRCRLARHLPVANRQRAAWFPTLPAAATAVIGRHHRRGRNYGAAASGANRTRKPPTT